jgi:hypothetical protein
MHVDNSDAKGIGLCSWIPLLPAVVLLVIIAFLPGEVSQYTRDPMAVANGSPFYGFLSNLGVLLWASTLAIAWFCGRPSLVRARDRRRFLIGWGALTCLLMIDDLFMLHDRIGPGWWGIRERYFVLLHAGVFGILLLRTHRVLRDVPRASLLLAITFFVASLAIDKMPEDILPLHHLFEDGFKFLGIVAWLTITCLICSLWTTRTDRVG